MLLFLIYRTINPKKNKSWKFTTMFKRSYNGLIFSLLLLAVTSNGLAAAPAFKNEILKYKLKYLNLNVAELEFSRTDSSATCGETASLLRISARSTSTATSLFSVNNKYRVTFLSANFLPLKIEKKIDQKNIQHDITLKFDQQSQIASRDDSLSWAIPSPCYDYFTMLYFLRSLTLNGGEKLSFYLDAEWLISRVEAEVNFEIENIKVPAGTFTARRLNLIFLPLTAAKRPWKTDLLTNRLAAPGSKLTLWLSSDARKIPIKITYHNSMIKTELLLYSTEFKESTD